MTKEEAWREGLKLAKDMEEAFGFNWRDPEIFYWLASEISERFGEDK